jgi:anti-anti-sigma factor
VRLAELTVDVRGRLIHATVRGDIDLSNAAELRSELTTMIPNDALGLVLDLAQVQYLDSAGLHLIHYLREDLRGRGQSLALVIPPESPIHDTLRLAGLEWDADIAGTVEDARRRLQPCGSG